MVELTVTYRVQQALVAALNKRFDGEAFIGSVQNPKFIVDFFAHDRTIVTSEDIEDFINDFTATYEGTEYAVTIGTVPDTRYKYQYVLEIETDEE